MLTWYLPCWPVEGIPSDVPRACNSDRHWTAQKKTNWFISYSHVQIRCFSNTPAEAPTCHPFLDASSSRLTAAECHEQWYYTWKSMSYITIICPKLPMIIAGETRYPATLPAPNTQDDPWPSFSGLFPVILRHPAMGWKMYWARLKLNRWTPANKNFIIWP